MNIGFFLPSATKLFFPECGTEITGGAEINLYNLAVELAKNDKNSVTFYVSDDGQVDEKIIKKVNVKKIKNLNKKTGKLVTFMRKIYLIWQILKFQDDFTISSTASEHLGLLVFVQQKLKNKAVIYRMAHDYNYDFSKYVTKGKRFYTLYKYGLSNVDYIISQTEHQKEELEKIGLDSLIIKNGFSVEDNGKKKKDIILWVARATKAKRPDIYLALAENMPDFQFVMIMPENMNKESIKLKSEVKEKSKQIKNLTFIDYVEPSEIQRYYDQAKIFVNTSDSEGFPNTFIQSGLAKTPIISFLINPDHMFDSHEIGLFCDDDIEKAISFINNSSEKELSMLGEHMFEFVVENHSIEVVANKYQQIFEEKS